MESIIFLIVITVLLLILLRQTATLKKTFGTYRNLDRVLDSMKKEKMITIDDSLESYKDSQLESLDREMERKRIATELSFKEENERANDYIQEKKEHLEQEYNDKRKNLEEGYLNLSLENKQRKDELREILENDIKRMNEDKEQIASVLQDLKDKQKNTIVALKETAKNNNEIEFNKVQLSKLELDDIEALKKVEKLIHNKDVLRKLIYKTYIEKPMNEMFNRLDIKTEPGIYKITNLGDKKVYIGQSVNVRNRIREHLKSAVGISSIAQQGVHEAMADEGIENFTFHLIDKCEREQLNDREKYWIDFYKSNEWGYNRTRGGA